MSSLKNLVKTRTYRERSQPASRSHLGLLEKHKDYVKRAKDFHRKEDALQKLREKAAFRNPDEYYFKMAHTRMKDGAHRKADRAQHTQDELVKFKTEDANYLMVKSTAEAKKIERLRAELHMLDAPLTNKHTRFVADVAAAAGVDAVRPGTTPAEVALAPPAQRGKRRRVMVGNDGSDAPPDGADGVGVEGGEMSQDDGDVADGVGSGTAPRLPKKARAKLERARAANYSELEQRVERHSKMARALERISIDKALQGKGARRRLKRKEDGGPKIFKFKPRRKK